MMWEEDRISEDGMGWDGIGMGYWRMEWDILIPS
jgi:hypothetical protein